MPLWKGSRGRGQKRGAAAWWCLSDDGRKDVLGEVGYLDDRCKQKEISKGSSLEQTYSEDVRMLKGGWVDRCWLRGKEAGGGLKRWCGLLRGVQELGTTAFREEVLSEGVLLSCWPGLSLSFVVRGVE